MLSQTFWTRSNVSDNKPFAFLVKYLITYNCTIWQELLTNLLVLGVADQRLYTFSPFFVLYLHYLWSILSICFTFRFYYFQLIFLLDCMAHLKNVYLGSLNLVSYLGFNSFSAQPSFLSRTQVKIFMLSSCCPIWPTRLEVLLSTWTTFESSLFSFYYPNCCLLLFISPICISIWPFFPSFGNR